MGRHSLIPVCMSTCERPSVVIPEGSWWDRLGEMGIEAHNVSDLTDATAITIMCLRVVCRFDRADHGHPADYAPPSEPYQPRSGR